MKRPGLPSRIAGMRLAAMLLAALPLASIGLVAFAAQKPVASSAEEPEYPHGSFQGDCSECHADDGWKPARIGRRFDHAKRSGFALGGAHASLRCAACHGTLDFTQQRQVCASCHQDPHLGEFGPDCARCHTPRSFLDRAGMVRMHQLTRFPLAGAHAVLDCEGCHPMTSQGRLRFTSTGTECYSCHRSDFAGTTSPAHAAAGFPTDCLSCHTPLAWRPARFTHTGAVDCYSCHRSDYEGTTAPAHVAAGFPTRCATCHTPRSWLPSTFAHNATAFPLTGAHVPAPCASCHGSPWQSALATDCYSCHKPAYDATTNPAHAAAGFPVTCATCHSTSAWSGATFDHSWFPISSGRHSGNTCSTCHTVPTSYASFSCLSGCHSRSDTDGHHSGVSGYQYNSAACYSCHPRGSAG